MIAVCRIAPGHLNKLDNKAMEQLILNNHEIKYSFNWTWVHIRFLLFSSWKNESIEQDINYRYIMSEPKNESALKIKSEHARQIGFAGALATETLGEKEWKSQTLVQLLAPPEPQQTQFVAHARS